MLHPRGGLSLRDKGTTHGAIYDWCSLHLDDTLISDVPAASGLCYDDSAGFNAADNSSEIVFDVHAEGPVFCLIITDMTAKSKRWVFANGVRSEESFALELVV